MKMDNNNIDPTLMHPQKSSSSSWKRVLYLCTGMFAVSAVFYCEFLQQRFDDNNYYSKFSSSSRNNTTNNNATNNNKLFETSSSNSTNKSISINHYNKRRHDYSSALLPVGSTMQHNLEHNKNTQQQLLLHGSTFLRQQQSRQRQRQRRRQLQFNPDDPEPVMPRQQQPPDDDEDLPKKEDVDEIITDGAQPNCSDVFDGFMSEITGLTGCNDEADGDKGPSLSKPTLPNLTDILPGVNEPHIAVMFSIAIPNSDDNNSNILIKNITNRVTRAVTSVFKDTFAIDTERSNDYKIVILGDYVLDLNGRWEMEYHDSKHKKRHIIAQPITTFSWYQIIIYYSIFRHGGASIDPEQLVEISNRANEILQDKIESQQLMCSIRYSHGIHEVLNVSRVGNEATTIIDRTLPDSKRKAPRDCTEKEIAIEIYVAKENNSTTVTGTESSDNNIHDTTTIDNIGMVATELFKDQLDVSCDEFGNNKVILLENETRMEYRNSIESRTIEPNSNAVGNNVSSSYQWYRIALLYSIYGMEEEIDDSILEQIKGNKVIKDTINSKKIMCDIEDILDIHMVEDHTDIHAFLNKPMAERNELKRQANCTDTISIRDMRYFNCTSLNYFDISRKPLRILGGLLFSVTLISFLVMMLLATKRKELRNKRLMWRIKLTEDGVQNFLRYDYNLRRDGIMIVYDQLGLGYYNHSTNTNSPAAGRGGGEYTLVGGVRDFHTEIITSNNWQQTVATTTTPSMTENNNNNSPGTTTTPTTNDATEQLSPRSSENIIFSDATIAEEEGNNNNLALATTELLS